MPNNNINYLNKDFKSYKKSLKQYINDYFPDVFPNLDNNDPANVYINAIAFVSDILSFYGDNQINENFLTLSNESKNIFNQAFVFGYKPRLSYASQVELTVTQLIPAIENGNGEYVPDYTYALEINEGASINSSTGVGFITKDKINFAFSSSIDPTTVSINNLNTITNKPEYYLLSKKVQAFSANIATSEFTLGDSERFLSLNLNDPNFIGINKIYDSSNNEYYEVPFLGQETIFTDETNTSDNNPSLSQYNSDTPYLLKLKTVPRRFTLKPIDTENVQLLFGSGLASTTDEEIVPNPDNVGIGLPNSVNKLDTAYDPSNFLYTNTYGVVPRNTTLTVEYYTGGGITSNVVSNTINEINNIEITQREGLNTSLSNLVRNSLTFNNEGPSTGGKSGDTNEEIKQNALANFSTQLRAVTNSDYVIRCLSLPAKYGSISKAYITGDTQLNSINDRISNPLGLNLYVLGYSNNKQLTNLNLATKTNLKTYLDRYRMITDSINIKDAYIINIGVNFNIIVAPGNNNQEVLIKCINKLKEYFNIDNWQINQPIILSEIYNELYSITGVRAVKNIIINNLAGEELGYSKYKYNINGATKEDVIYPSLDPSIFEIKYPNKDIRGKIINI